MPKLAPHRIVDAYKRIETEKSPIANEALLIETAHQCKVEVLDVIEALKASPDWPVIKARRWPIIRTTPEELENYRASTGE